MKVINTPVKAIKKFFYQGRIKKFRQLVLLMLLGGLITAAAYFVRTTYINYAVSNAHVVLSYPEISAMEYPDGSRFGQYDFVSDERIKEALNVMQQNGKYKYFTVDDLRDCFNVYTYLDTSASTYVSTVRSEGNDFSYVANEYSITFVQPHDYKNPSLLKRFFTPDNSAEFLRVLLENNKKYISNVKGGVDGFRIVSDLGDLDGYDYDEKITVYRTKKTAVSAYLDALEKMTPKFRSRIYGLSIKDIEGKYDLNITNRLDSISHFVESSGISKNADVAANKIKVNIENNLLLFKKFRDQVTVNSYAMDHYDHTFTENLINVVRDDIQGLYQARPKTAFDTVVKQMNDSNESVSEYQEIITGLANDLRLIGGGEYEGLDEVFARKEVETIEDEPGAYVPTGNETYPDVAAETYAEETAVYAPAYEEYGYTEPDYTDAGYTEPDYTEPDNAIDSIAYDPEQPEQPVTEYSDEEMQRLHVKCDALFDDLAKEYTSLTDFSRLIVTECLHEMNETFITSKVRRSSPFTLSFVAKLGIMFVVGALVAFVLSVFVTAISDSVELRRKHRMLWEIKRAGRRM